MKKNQYIAPVLKQRLTMEVELPIAQSLPVGEGEITDSGQILSGRIGYDGRTGGK